MRLIRFARARRVESEAQRQGVLAVLRATYLHEKGWVLDAETLFPTRDLGDRAISWFLATVGDTPVGVLRLSYDPPVEQFLSYGLKPIDAQFRVEEFLRNQRIVEIGRFAVVPHRRTEMGVALSLMRAALREVVSRDCTQLVTDVFENDPHSPLKFHTRILGFKPVATHETGELRYSGRRITLLLDIKAAYHSLKTHGKWLFKSITRGWTQTMHSRLAT